ncbi:hypothetical protein Tco_0843597 [Tanacetum coccineum]|uniref:Uncharacterized protein n=1 Tax=Tanacetum coccineum TaxID=301880 RepID=A0ABQ5B2J5_9ASTR
MSGQRIATLRGHHQMLSDKGDTGVGDLGIFHCDGSHVKHNKATGDNVGPLHPEVHYLDHQDTQSLLLTQLSLQIPKESQCKWPLPQVALEYAVISLLTYPSFLNSKGYDSCEKNTFLHVIESYTVINFLDMLGQRIYDNSFRALKDDEGLFLVRWGTRWRLRFSGKMIKAGEKNSALVDEVKYGCNGVIMHFPKSVMQENAQSSEGSKEVTSTDIVKFESNNGIGSSNEGKPRKKKRRSFFPRFFMFYIRKKHSNKNTFLPSGNVA